MLWTLFISYQLNNKVKIESATINRLEEEELYIGGGWKHSVLGIYRFQHCSIGIKPTTRPTSIDR